MQGRQGHVVQGSLEDGPLAHTNAIRSGKLSEPEAISMIDQLAGTSMALPTDGIGFLAWAHQEGILPQRSHPERTA
jgi:hypothetical protein